jgi:hypothetical protein
MCQEIRQEIVRTKRRHRPVIDPRFVTFRSVECRPLSIRTQARHGGAMGDQAAMQVIASKPAGIHVDNACPPRSQSFSKPFETPILAGLASVVTMYQNDP